MYFQVENILKNNYYHTLKHFHNLKSHISLAKFHLKYIL